MKPPGLTYSSALWLTVPWPENALPIFSQAAASSVMRQDLRLACMTIALRSVLAVTSATWRDLRGSTGANTAILFGGGAFMAAAFVQVEDYGPQGGKARGTPAVHDRPFFADGIEAEARAAENNIDAAAAIM
jgi:hypothetical protein